MYGPMYKKLIKDICGDLNIDFQEITSDLLCLMKNEQKEYIWSRRFPHTSLPVGRIVDSKSLCSNVLFNYGIPVVKHQKLFRYDSEEFNRFKKSNFAICFEMLKEHGQIVLKPDNSCEGSYVFKCCTVNEIEFALFTIFSKYKTAAVSPYINIKNEYRAFYLEGKILLVYKKIRPFVIGDGVSSLETLVNLKYEHNDFFDKKFINDSLIPLKGEEVLVGWKHNLSQKSTPELVEDTSITEKISRIAINVGSAINAGFVTIDIIEEYDNTFKVLEVNSGVAMDQFLIKHENGYNIAYGIYEAAIKYLFNI